MVLENKINLAKNPANIGIPAIESNAAVETAANKGFVFPNPLKLIMSSLSLFLQTNKITPKAAIPANE